MNIQSSVSLLFSDYVMLSELKGCSVYHVVDDLLESLWWFAASACSLLQNLAGADD
jgi:hypothetical protein